MRRSEADAAVTRETIVASAADEIRRYGIAETSISRIMTAVGLTHGGFYNHFDNKEQLVAKAVSYAGFRLAEDLTMTVKAGGNAFDAYVCTAGLDTGEPSACPLLALGSELARAGPEVREAASNVLTRMLAAFGPSSFENDDRDQATMELAALIGAITLAKITCDFDLVDRVSMGLRRTER